MYIFVSILYITCIFIYNIYIYIYYILYTLHIKDQLVTVFLKIMSKFMHSREIYFSSRSISVFACNAKSFAVVFLLFF